MKKKVITSILFVCIIFCASAKIFLIMVDGFTLSNIHLDIPFHKEWQIQHTNDEVAFAKYALNQTYHYLGKGTQSYAFLSNDGKYILKFIKCQRLRLLPIYEKLPLFGWLEKGRQKKIQEKKELQKKLFTSFVLAKEQLKEETQVLFAHINKTPFYEKTVILFDKAGFKHEVAIDNVPFVLQKKVQPIFQTLEDLYEKNERIKLKDRLNQIIKTLYSLSLKQIQVHDSNLIARNNLGFTDDKASFIDIGSFASCKNGNMLPEKTLKSLKPISHWLQQRDPELAQYFKSVLDKLTETDQM